MPSKNLRRQSCLPSRRDAGALLDKVDAAGWTVLHRAAHGGSEEIMALLLDTAASRGATVNGRTRRGEAALHVACRRDNVAVVKLLLRRGASALDASDGQHATPLHVAAEQASFSCAQAILEASQNTGPRALQEVLHSRDADSRTPLHLAASSGHFQLCKLMVKLGAPLVGSRQARSPFFSSSSPLEIHSGVHQHNERTMQRESEGREEREEEEEQQQEEE